eukprot:gene31484-38052_t
MILAPLLLNHEFRPSTFKDAVYLPTIQELTIFGK